MKRALLIIDIQKDYFPGGKMELVEPELAAQNARKLLDYFRSSGETIIHIQHTSVHQGATFFLPGTEGVEIHPLLQPVAGETLIAKNFPNSFRETSLEPFLRENNITGLVICGMMSHICVDTTVRRGSDLYFDMTLIHDACATRSLEFQGKALAADLVHGSYMAALQRFAKVTSTEEFLANQTA